MSSITLTSTREMSREDWLKARRAGIGGSDAAALVGMNPYSSPWAVWADKLGFLPEKEESEPIRLGNDLEPYVAKRFCEISGLKVNRTNAIIGNQKYPFALANIDRKILGRHAGLECKTTSAWHVKEYKNGSFPDRFYAQCVHYLAVTGWDEWFLAVLVLGEGLHIYHMKRNEAAVTPTWCEGSVYVDNGEICALMESEEAFWSNHVLTGIPPATDGEEATTKAIRAFVGDADDPGTKDLSCDISIRNYLALKDQKKAIEKEMERCKQSILIDLGSAERGICGSYSVSNAPTTRRSFDAAAFQRVFPTIDLSSFYKVTSSTTFAIKEAKK